MTDQSSGPFRLERDMIGELAVPMEAYYGINTLRTCRNLSFSRRQLGSYPGYIRSLALVKKAAALANLEAGELDGDRAHLIATACDSLAGGEYADQFPVDVLHGGGGIGINMNINEVIANIGNVSAGHKLGDNEPLHPVEHVNMSQSTSDVCHTAMRMTLVGAWAGLKQELDGLHGLAKMKAAEFAEVRTIARTCLQDGMPVSYGDTFGGYAALFARRIGALDNAFGKLQKVNLGGTVIGSGLGAPEAYRRMVMEKLRAVTGESYVWRESLYDAAQNPDDLAEVSAQLALLAQALLKVAKDFRLLSSGPEAGFAELILPSVQAGSSFFPGKVNPVVAETLIQCCFQVMGCDRVVQAAAEHGELNLNVWEPAAGINILEAVQMLEAAVRQFAEKCFSSVTVNRERCEAYAGSLIPLVVEMKEIYGYAAVSSLLKEAKQQGKDPKTWLKQGGERDGAGVSGLGERMAEDN
ncbi:lyase family protein [Paenibacillus thalictri]|uniref:Aspartate ammonia-lyase n=1 Tax=Paenibacillus thalictri TaxID=2527873 RepID=A0A4V2J4S1_9BACL|nr:lyase family protein [Paenibacillus thalictri]TBL81002.1 aspartate ammonia-lyase [Paenibacillus thalictri]